MNDFTDFSMPYKIYGKLAQEIMRYKYSRLHNYSKGLNRRFLIDNQIRPKLLKDGLNK